MNEAIEAAALAKRVAGIAWCCSGEWLEKDAGEVTKKAVSRMACEIEGVLTRYAEAVRREAEESMRERASNLCAAEAKKWRDLIALGGAHSNWRGVTAHESDAKGILALRLSSPQPPEAALPPIGEGPCRSMLIEIDVTEDFEQRLDNQWMVEREIAADRWSWRWAPLPSPQPPAGKDGAESRLIREGVVYDHRGQTA